MKLPGEELISGIIGIGKELIVDKDKQVEFAFKAQEQLVQFQLALLQTKTTPKVDAFVKVVYSLKGFIRPIGGALMTGFGMYCHLKQIPIDTTLHAVLDGALPAWGVSRHVEKNSPKKKAPVQEAYDDEWED